MGWRTGNWGLILPPTTPVTQDMTSQLPAALVPSINYLGAKEIQLHINSVISSVPTQK